MSRETVQEKSIRYIADGRLEIDLVSQGRVVASCRGDRGDVYAIDFDPAAGSGLVAARLGGAAATSRRRRLSPRRKKCESAGGSAGRRAADPRPRCPPPTRREA
jgi:hypothetical protein